MDFGPRFIELARSVYSHNDRRCALKRQINLLLGTRLIEEKSCAPTGGPAGGQPGPDSFAPISAVEDLATPATEAGRDNEQTTGSEPWINTRHIRLKGCRHGPMLYIANDRYIGQSLDRYGEFSEGEMELFKQFKPTTIGKTAKCARLRKGHAMKDENQSRPIWTPAILAAFHAMLWIVLLGLMCGFVPSFEKIFIDFDAEIPQMTLLAIVSSNFLICYWYLVPPFLAAFFTVDLIVLYVLYGHPKASVPRWLWLALMLFVPWGLMALAVLAMVLPLVALIQNLS